MYIYETAGKAAGCELLWLPMLETQGVQVGLAMSSCNGALTIYSSRMGLSM